MKASTLKRNAANKKLTAKVALTAKAANEANKKETRSISALIKWANEPKNTKVVAELNALNAKYKVEFTQPNINKGLLKFALVHELNKVDSNYLPTEQKRLFAYSFISKLLKRKAIYTDATNGKFVALCVNAKESHIAREQIKAENIAFVNELTASNNVDLLAGLLTAQNNVLELVEA